MASPQGSSSTPRAIKSTTGLRQFAALESKLKHIANAVENRAVGIMLDSQRSTPVTELDFINHPRSSICLRVPSLLSLPRPRNAEACSSTRYTSKSYARYNASTSTPRPYCLDKNEQTDGYAKDDASTSTPRPYSLDKNEQTDDYAKDDVSTYTARPSCVDKNEQTDDSPTMFFKSVVDENNNLCQTDSIAKENKPSVVTPPKESASTWTHNLLQYLDMATSTPTSMEPSHVGFADTNTSASDIELIPSPSTCRQLAQLEPIMQGHTHLLRLRPTASVATQSDFGSSRRTSLANLTGPLVDSSIPMFIPLTPTEHNSAAQELLAGRQGNENGDADALPLPAAAGLTGDIPDDSSIETLLSDIREIHQQTFLLEGKLDDIFCLGVPLDTPPPPSRKVQEYQANLDLLSCRKQLLQTENGKLMDMIHRVGFARGTPSEQETELALTKYLQGLYESMIVEREIKQETLPMLKLQVSRVEDYARFLRDVMTAITDTEDEPKPEVETIIPELTMELKRWKGQSEHLQETNESLITEIKRLNGEVLGAKEREAKNLKLAEKLFATIKKLESTQEQLIRRLELTLREDDVVRSMGLEYADHSKSQAKD